LGDEGGDGNSQCTAGNSQSTIHNAQLGDEECEGNSQCTAGNSQSTIHNAQLGDEGSDAGVEESAHGGDASGKLKTGDGEPKGAGCGSLDKELSALEIMLAAERDKYLRLAAEYDNYRKRSGKEREATYATARADTITRLLPVYDNLERALKMECADEAFFKGVEMMMTQLTEILEGMNIRRIQAVGETFDPNRHNAVMSVVDPGLGEKVVAEEYQKGFMLGERVIRHSTVVVAN